MRSGEEQEKRRRRLHPSALVVEFSPDVCSVGAPMFVQMVHTPKREPKANSTGHIFAYTSGNTVEELVAVLQSNV